MDMNLHYVELFYHVARHGGQSAAARKMPYGIQPSTISRQICALERLAGVTLYVREPFKLTPAGEELFEFIRPMFEELPRLFQRLGQGKAEVVRIGASAIVLREYLPAILPSVRRNFPHLQLAVKEGLQAQIDLWLRENLVEIAVTVLNGEPPKGYLSEPLLWLPLTLLVPESSRLRSAAELWRRQPVRETLIGPGSEDAITKYFSQGLERQGVRWSVGLEANSMELVETYVRRGLGFGMSVALPRRKVSAELRALALSDFPRVPVGMIWRSNPSGATEALMREFRQRAGKIAAPSRGDLRFPNGAARTPG